MPCRRISDPRCPRTSCEASPRGQPAAGITAVLPGQRHRAVAQRRREQNGPCRGDREDPDRAGSSPTAAACSPPDVDRHGCRSGARTIAGCCGCVSSARLNCCGRRRPGAGTAIVIGSGFIGCEAAVSLARRGSVGDHAVRRGAAAARPAGTRCCRTHLRSWLADAGVRFHGSADIIEIREGRTVDIQAADPSPPS